MNLIMNIVNIKILSLKKLIIMILFKVLNEIIKKRKLEINSGYFKSFDLVYKNEIKGLFKKEDTICMILSNNESGTAFLL
jgi:hypothetical protein